MKRRWVDAPLSVDAPEPIAAIDNFHYAIKGRNVPFHQKKIPIDQAYKEAVNSASGFKLNKMFFGYFDPENIF